MKFIHVADLGLKNLPYGGINPETGLNKRFEDVLYNFKWIISHAIKEKVDYFVIAGDINEERNPESILIEKFSECIADLISSNIKVIMIAGNHDIDSSAGTSSSISYIKALGLVNTYVADLGPEVFEFDDVCFHCVPTMFPPKMGSKDNQELTNKIDEYISEKELVNGKPNILVAHYTMEDTFPGLNIDEPILYINTLKKFDYVALGHIHKWQMYKEFQGGYSGSMFTKDFGEQNDKYFNLVDIDVEANKIKKAQIQIPERKFIQLDIDVREMSVEDAMKKIEDKIKSNNLAKAVIKVRLQATKRFNPKMIYELLRKKEVFHYIPIQWDIQKDELVKKIDVKPQTTDTDIVKEYMELQKDDNKFKENVIKYLSEVIKRWEQELGAV